MNHPDTTDRKFTRHRMEVTVTKVIDIDVVEDALTPEAVAEFGKVIFEATAEEIVGHIAMSIGRFGAHFVEGVGYARETWHPEESSVRFTVIDEDAECSAVTATKEGT